VKWYHNKAYYSEKITAMNMAFIKFNKKLQEANDNSIESKKEALTRFKHFIMMIMNEDIRWYWKPEQVIRCFFLVINVVVGLMPDKMCFNISRNSLCTKYYNREMAHCIDTRTATYNKVN
jgi:hypothetical protein